MAAAWPGGAAPVRFAPVFPPSTEARLGKFCSLSASSPLGVAAVTATPSVLQFTAAFALGFATVAAQRLRPQSLNQRQRQLRTAVSVVEGSKAAPQEVDVCVVGAGPAGTLLSYLLAERHGLSVCLLDPAAAAPWPNNYGVWQEEWDALEAKLQIGLEESLDTQWTVTDCYFGGSWGIPNEERLRLDRPYARVDRKKLKSKLQSSRIEVVTERIDVQAVASNIFSNSNLSHDAEGTRLSLPSGRVLQAKMVVDATGSESLLTRRLVAAGQPVAPDPGFQIAYGMECIVDGNTYYALDAMTLFDYRTDHLSMDSDWEDRASKSPTFMYAMPLGKEEGFGNGQRIFFEETSLVARPGVSFEECKQRCLQRLKHLGVTVRPGSITDEEFCYIPMGGALPEPGQRIVAFGGAAATVHPATGYQLCRMMAGAKELAEALANGLTNSTLFDPDATAAAAYEALWSPENQAQRDFAVFGGEFLMSLDVAALRGWFDGFFRLPEPLWAGFLAGWPTLPGNELHESWFARLSFGIQLLLRIPGPVALRLAAGIAGYTVTYGTSLMRSVTPLFGSPPSYAWSPPVPPEQLGDPAAKSEARAMMAASRGK